MTAVVLGSFIIGDPAAVTLRPAVKETVKFDQAELQRLARESRPWNSLMEMDVAELQANARATAPRKGARTWRSWAAAGFVAGFLVVLAVRLLQRL